MSTPNMNDSLPVSMESFETYSYFLAGKPVNPSYRILCEAWYFHDAEYTRRLCNLDLAVSYICKLPLLVFPLFFDQLSMETRSSLVYNISELYCKAYMFLKRPTRLKMLEYIEEINSDDSVLTSTSTITSESESQFCDDCYRAQLSQLLVDEMCASSDPVSMQNLKNLFRGAYLLHFKSQNVAYMFIDQHLRNLSLAGNNFTTLSIRPSRYLRYLDFSNNQLGDAEMPQICAFLHEGSITRLRLDHNRFTAASAPILAEVLPFELRDLNIAGNNFGSGICTILDKLCTSRYLQLLDVSFNNLGGADLENCLKRLLDCVLTLAQLRCFDEQIDRGLTQELVANYYHVDIQMNEEINVTDVANCQNTEYRRKLERALFYSSDSSAADAYFLVSNAWLEYWKYFIMGGEKPAYVDNTNRDQQFRAVNKVVWRIISQLYGGGPEIQVTTDQLQP